jgi:hypothetical protein
MLKICYGNTNYGNAELVNYLKEQKEKNKKFRVIDVGGARVGWSREVCDVLVDLNANSPGSFSFNISIQDNWNDLLNYVNIYGKFDFAICTHTIEDIVNPGLVLTMLPKIAKQGYITTPSIRAELSNVESPNWLGYIHHRHIIDHSDKKIILAPKLGFVQHLIKDQLYLDTTVEEICIFWEDTIEYEFIMNDYLGPDVNTVLNEYLKFINKSYNQVIPNKWY